MEMLSVALEQKGMIRGGSVWLAGVPGHGAGESTRNVTRRLPLTLTTSLPRRSPLFSRLN